MDWKNFLHPTDKPRAPMPSAFLALPTIAERRAWIAKTLVIEEALLSRMANALVEELDFRLVTDAPKMMAAIREAERQTVRFAPQSNPYVPYPRLLFFPYESGIRLCSS